MQNPFAVRSSHPLLSERAVEAVRQWRFYPGRRDGRLVNTHMQAPVVFVLEDEQLDGIDGLLSWARSRAEELGATVLKDAGNLRPARALHRVSVPKLLDGTPTPDDASGVVLLVLDQAGVPQRGHILLARPEAFGPALLAAASAARYQLRMENGQPVPANVVFSYSAKPRDSVLK